MEVLADFAARHGITYPLLSDEGSRVIRALGLYNEHLAEQARFYGREARPDQFGVPYPGIFRLDEQGRIVGKEFEQSYRVRPAPSLLLSGISGGAQAQLAVCERVESNGVTLTAGVDSATYRPYERHQLHVTAQLDPGVHVYGAPVPDGYTALEIAIAPFEGLDASPVQLPDPHPFRVVGLDEDFLVYEGVVDAVVPFNIVPHQEHATLSVTVRYQACTESACFPPQEAIMEITLRGVDLIRD